MLGGGGEPKKKADVQQYYEMDVCMTMKDAIAKKKSFNEKSWKNVVCKTEGL
jgi:hypothetical protein